VLQQAGQFITLLAGVIADCIYGIWRECCNSYIYLAESSFLCPWGPGVQWLCHQPPELYRSSALQI